MYCIQNEKAPFGASSRSPSRAIHLQVNWIGFIVRYGRKDAIGKIRKVKGRPNGALISFGSCIRKGMANECRNNHVRVWIRQHRFVKIMAHQHFAHTDIQNQLRQNG